MSNTDFDTDNIIPVTEANLRDEQKQAMAKAMEEYKQLCLKSFSVNRSSEVIQKEALSMPRQITFEGNPGKLQEMMDNAINHALINQSSVLSNTVFNVVARTFKEGHIPPSYVGSAYHQPRSSSVTTPSAPPAVAGTEVTSPPSTLGMTNGQSTPMRTNSNIRGTSPTCYRSIGIGNVRVCIPKLSSCSQRVGIWYASRLWCK